MRLQEFSPPLLVRGGLPREVSHFKRRLYLLAGYLAAAALSPPLVVPALVEAWVGLERGIDCVGRELERLADGKRRPVLPFQDLRHPAAGDDDLPPVAGDAKRLVIPDHPEVPYDGAKMIIEAIRRAGLNRYRIRDELAAMEHYHGVTGEIILDGVFSDRGPVAVATFTNGRWIFGQPRVSRLF